MKKLFIILVVVIGLVLNANAQECDRPIRNGVTGKFVTIDGVSKAHNHSNIDFSNANDYRVGITYVIIYNGKEIIDEQYIRLEPKVSSHDGRGNYIGQWYWADEEKYFNPKYLCLKIKSVEKLNW